SGRMEARTPENRIRKWLAPVAIFVGLMTLYQLNGAFHRIGDAQANQYLPVQVLARGKLTFSPDAMPFMFLWRQRQSGSRPIGLNSWDQVVNGRAASDLRAAGELEPVEPRYYLVETVRPGRYAGIYGPGPGLIALPYFA